MVITFKLKLLQKYGSESHSSASMQRTTIYNLNYYYRMKVLRQTWVKCHPWGINIHFTKEVLGTLYKVHGTTAPNLDPIRLVNLM